MMDSQSSLHSSMHSSVHSSVQQADSDLEHSFYEEYPPKQCQEVLERDGIHYYRDGHFWMEVPGLPESDDDDEDYPIPVKKNTKVTFSTGPIKVILKELPPESLMFYRSALSFSKELYNY